MKEFITREEYEALPPKLQKQVRVHGDDWLILEIVKDFGGRASLDRLLIEFYRRTGQIKKRTQMVSMAYRAIQRGMPIISDKKNKVVYLLVDEKDKK